MRIRLLPEAEQDLARGADFYEAQKAGLGVYFHDCLSSDIESLNLFAGIHERYRGFYRLLSKRFPYVVYYQTHGDYIDVFAVLDARQDPRIIDATLDSARPSPSAESSG